MKKPLFRKVLIANRGEIAVRVIRACHEMGIPTVVVYSSADRRSRAVRLADEAVCIGAPEARLSYLDPEKILRAARDTGAEAVHPGYGFLSENESFARRVQESGLTFIGPDPACIEAMGDKINSRRRMMEAGVPVIPGRDDVSFTETTLRDAARDIGYPVMLKATAGGGGKGIRLIRDEGELWPAYERVMSEAGKSFGDGRIYLEKFVEGPHHIEFQIFGDKHGNMVHLFERECSIQRRHQKVVEETPSPFLTSDLRARMAEAAVLAGKSISYNNAGTIEFLVDKYRNFYFLEMNTRLQVEHPITEETLGIDLVKEQLRVAAGLPLSWKQDDLQPEGHAIEVRICAEDPDNNYLPAVGSVESITTPAGPGVRIDSALYRGLDVSLYYDSMLAKLITKGVDRAESINRLRQALSEFKIAGIKTNISLLSGIIRDPRFVAGEYDTGFLADYSKPPLRPELLEAALVAAALKRHLHAAPASRASKTGTTENSWKMFARRKGLRHS